MCLDISIYGIQLSCFFFLGIDIYKRLSLSKIWDGGYTSEYLVNICVHLFVGYCKDVV